MSDKFEDFMKRNIPAAEGALNPLELKPRKNWLAGLAVSGVLAASLAVVMVNQSNEYQALVEAEEALDARFDDEFPSDYQDVDSILDEM